jgi:hypothetical protein
MKKYANNTLTAIVILLLTVTVSAGSADNADSSELGVESLSPELRTLLSQEMLALQKGMQSILPAYVSGEYGEVSKIAEKIKNSFILKQKISDAQKKELGAKLPKAFIALDKQFHEYAGMLEHVAEEQHTELVGFYYYKLMESCLGCHTQYAQHKFPKLAPKSGHHEHHH